MSRVQRIKDKSEGPNQETPNDLEKLFDDGRVEWLPKVLQKHPEVVELTERSRPLSGAPTYGRSVIHGKTEVKEVLSHTFVLQLIAQYLKDEGFEDTANVLQSEYNEDLLDDSLRNILQNLLAIGIKDPNNILEPPAEMDEKSKTEIVQTTDFFPSVSHNAEEGTADKNIWEPVEDLNECLLMDSDQRTVVAGTLNELIKHLTSDKLQDLGFRKAFLMTYPAFTSPEKLFEKLLQRYNVPSEDAEYVKNIQIRVISVIKYWCDTCLRDFNDKLLATLNSFIDNVMVRDGHTQLAKQLRNSLAKTPTTAAGAAANTKTYSKPPDPKLPQNIFSSTLTLDHVHEEEVARQLTLLDFQIYQAVQPSELLCKSWMSEEAEYLSPNVCKMIQWNNTVARWVACTIVNTPKVKVRAKVLARFVKIGEYLKNLGSFNTMVAIYAGLSNSTVYRLKFTFQELKDPIMKRTLDDFEKLLNPRMSYKNYRYALEKVISKAPGLPASPCIPYIGIHLRDLAIVEEGNPNKIKKMINFSKYIAIHKVINEFLRFQETSYNLQFVHQIAAFLRHLEIPLDDAQMHKKSLAIEPKDASIESIE